MRFTLLMAFFLCACSQGGGKIKDPRWTTRNNTSIDLTAWYIRPSSGFSWGSPVGSLFPGEELSIPLPYNRYYDSLWVWDDGSISYTYAIYLSPDEHHITTWEDYLLPVLPPIHTQ